jgi:hypothetical protein
VASTDPKGSGRNLQRFPPRAGLRPDFEGLGLLVTAPTGARVRLMPRKLRLLFPNAFYHVINRGNYRRDVFETSGGRDRMTSVR